jgi:hypothetical protein
MLAQNVSPIKNLIFSYLPAIKQVNEMLVFGNQYLSQVCIFPEKWKCDIDLKDEKKWDTKFVDAQAISLFCNLRG